MTDDLVKRPLDEEFDTMMEVQRNPHGAWEAIQTQAARIAALERERDAAYTIGYSDCENETSFTEIGRTNEFLHGQIAKYRDALAAMTAERDEAFNAAWRNGIAQEAAEARLAKCEARLSKAVEALRVLSCKCPSNCDWEHDDVCPSWTARATLAEMGGYDR